MSEPTYIIKYRYSRKAGLATRGGRWGFGEALFSQHDAHIDADRLLKAGAIEVHILQTKVFRDV